MGIKNLNKLLKEKASCAFGTYLLSTWAGKRIAIDANNWFYTTMSIAHSDNVKRTDVSIDIPDKEQSFQIWLDRHLKYFIFRFLECGVTPVFIFDGTSPIEKDTTMLNRRLGKEETLVKIEEKKKEIATNLSVDSEESIETLRKLYRKVIPVSDGELEAFKCILSGMGIPFISANMEAEEAATILCIEGYVAAVFSADTDNLARGCPVVINRFDGRGLNSGNGKKEPLVFGVILNVVLKELGLSYSEFVDLCIMSGCDYNTNIPRVGVKISYDLIKKHKNIDNLPVQYDKTVLNHIQCRNMLKCKSVKEITDLDISNLQIDKDVTSLQTFGREILNSYFIGSWIEGLLEYYKSFPIAYNVLKCQPDSIIVKGEMKGETACAPVVELTPVSSTVNAQLKYLNSKKFENSEI